jgi:hypothetical protein
MGLSIQGMDVYNTDLKPDRQYRLSINSQCSKSHTREVMLAISNVRPSKTSSAVANPLKLLGV